MLLFIHTYRYINKLESLLKDDDIYENINERIVNLDKNITEKYK